MNIPGDVNDISTHSNLLFSAGAGFDAGAHVGAGTG